MSESKHQLAAIMFTDIVGYTDIMGRDQQKALELVRKNLEIQKPLIETYHGELLKEMGDGTLCKFSSASDAVTCALEIQRRARADFDGKLRIGIHLGDVTFENKEVYGDGVNIASRLESIADPGAIFISESVHKAIRGISDVQSQYLGEIQLKNVNYPLKTYTLQGTGLPIPVITREKGLSGHLWAELLRRNVLRAGIVYILFAGLLFQILTSGIISGDLFQSIENALIVVLPIGFGVSLYLAWTYEFSPHGFVRTSSLRSWRNPYSAGKKKPLTNNLVISVMLLINFGVLFFSGINPSLRSSTTPANEEGLISIAVMPFENMSGDPDMEPFCDGMTDAVISRLTKIEGINKVISRTSVMSYKKTQKTMPQIAKELAVTYILEAGFQKSGDDIRINLQLIDGPADNHYWSDGYDGKYGDIFKIQAEVAELVARNINANITPEEITDIQQTLTDNVEAYELYLRGNHIAFNQYAYRYNERDFLRARELYEKAIKLDSDFAEAYAALADLYDSNRLSYQSRGELSDFPKEYDSLRQALARKAYKLDPNSAFVNYAMTWTYVNRADSLRNLDSGYYHMKRALELDPGNALMNESMGGFLNQYLGLKEQALQYFNRSVELDPLAQNSYAFLSLLYRDLGNYQHMGEAIQTYMELSGETNHGLYIIYLINENRLEEAEMEIIAREKRDLGTDGLRAFLYATRGEREKALELVPELRERVKFDVYLKLGLMDSIYPILEDAIKSGWNGYQNMEYNKAFDPYQSDPEFIRIKEMAKELNDEYTRKYGITPIPKKL